MVNDVTERKQRITRSVSLAANNRPGNEINHFYLITKRSGKKGDFMRLKDTYSGKKVAGKVRYDRSTSPDLKVRFYNRGGWYDLIPVAMITIPVAMALIVK